MDLLYIHERYDRVLHVVDALGEKRFDSTEEKYPNACAILAVAACHKLVSSTDDLTT